MSVARYDHTATLLGDGRVLIVGGTVPRHSAHPSAEIFDPVTATFRPTRAPRFFRTAHTATELADGRVLIAGGHQHLPRDCPYVTNVAPTEIFDARSGAWSLGPELLQPRASHSATLLPSGRVCVVGGVEAYESLRDVEFIDLADQHSSHGPPLAAPRCGHQAILKAGRVLVIGGVNGHQSLCATDSLAEGGSWATDGFLPTGRVGHALTELSAGVAVIGGASDGVIVGDVLVQPS
jgi:hypothetical protein